MFPDRRCDLAPSCRTHVSLISSGPERMLLEVGYRNTGKVITVGEGGGR
jgi:hypothetical protein